MKLHYFSAIEYEIKRKVSELKKRQKLIKRLEQK